MSDSLRDQLLKAGLVTKTQVKQSKQEQRRQPQGKRVPAREPDYERLRAEAEKAERDRELNRKQQEKAERKARMAQIKQLIEQNRLPKVESDDYYNFIDENEIKRIAVNAEMREQIIQGSLAIVRYAGHYAVVPEAIAARIRERHEPAVIKRTASEARPDENDPYKDYVVPDDLMW
jgi:uncharacterized protein